MTAETGPRKKHRHDLGQEDHGPVMAERTTRGIQLLLGLWIGLTAIALVWTMSVAGGGPERAPTGAPAASTEPRTPH